MLITVSSPERSFAAFVYVFKYLEKLGLQAVISLHEFRIIVTKTNPIVLLVALFFAS